MSEHFEQMTAAPGEVRPAKPMGPLVISCPCGCGFRFYVTSPDPMWSGEFKFEMQVTRDA